MNKQYINFKIIIVLNMIKAYVNLQQIVNKFKIAIKKIIKNQFNIIQYKMKKK